ncbi:hypothetical protein BGX28_004013 [Mortierella sp. GBA30]|nr:hypothetical protein BGX28_004013 [Mortierella sp. GBA30]
MDRSKSDFALHQQNYGPYLDQSPTLEPLPMFTPKRYSASYSTPEDHSLFSSHERKPARIYGLDAADVPTRPPLAPSSSFGAQPLQDIPDGREVEYTRRPSSADAYERFPPSRDSSAANPPYVHDRRPSTTTTYEENQPHHQPAARSRYDYSSQETQKSSINANPSIPYAHPHSESRAYSPVMDIQPPSWYKQYANAVSLNNPPPPRASFSQGESAAYASVPRRGSDFGPSRNMHPQHRRSPEPWLARSSFSAAASPVADGVARPMSGAAAHGGNSYNHGLSKPKSRLASGHSVHPFDLPAESQGCSTSPKAGKRDRGQEEDQFSQENGGVKAKRKRANAEQLSVLNAAFERSYFPSTEERLRLSKQTKMCPRTVQIWFQNKRQSVKARTEAMDAAVAALPGRRRGSHSVLERPVGDGADERNFRNMADDDGAGTDYHYEHVRTPQQTLKQQPHQAQHPPPLQHISTFQGEKRRNSGPLTPSDALMSSLQIQYDGRSVDFFSRKRRATVARMELSDPR